MMPEGFSIGNDLLVGAALGVIGSIIAAFLYDIMKRLYNAYSMNSFKIELGGTWGEFIKESKGRQLSIGRIYFDKKRDLWAFDGTNFTNAGQAFCHWRTVTSHIDLDNMKYFYIFYAHVVGEPGATYAGFGVLNLSRDQGNRIFPINGHYVSDSVDGKGLPHTMKRLSEQQYPVAALSSDLIKLLRTK